MFVESLCIPIGTQSGTDLRYVILLSAFYFERCCQQVDDSELQDEPLQIRLMDHDTYSANDAIGKVYLDLNPLLLPAAGLLVRYGRNGDGNHEHSSNSVMSGWIPVYDTMHGIRGEVNVVVKVELFSDFNRFRQSSCGIQFFCCN